MNPIIKTWIVNNRMREKFEEMINNGEINIKDTDMVLWANGMESGEIFQVQFFDVTVAVGTLIENYFRERLLMNDFWIHDGYFYETIKEVKEEW